MGKLRQTALVLGEGPTEFFYFKSFFLYYFRYTSRPYEDQASLLKDLNNSVDYQKTEDFFRKSKGLHGYFERNGGSLKQAVVNADHSLEEKQESGRDYTYSELGRLIKALETL